MPIDGEEIYLNELEIEVMRAFFNTVHLTNSEIAGVLRGLAEKLDPHNLGFKP